jgi:hypothetical protein
MTKPSEPLPGNQAEFEQAVMNSVLRKYPSYANIIAEQFRLADIVARRGSGVGCYTDFNVPDTAPRLPDEVEYPLDSEPFLLRMDTALQGAPDWDDLEAKWLNPVPPQMRNSAFCSALLIHNQRGLITYLDCHSYGAAGWPTAKYDFWFPERPENDA